MTRDGIRLVTPDEVAHFRDHGWAKLDGLLAPELAGELLERAKARLERDATDHAAGWWVEAYDLVETDDRFESLGMSDAMALNAQRLMRRSVGVLLFSNLVAAKNGTRRSTPESDRGSAPSLWHQDGSSMPVDRGSWLRFWIALDQVTPEMGSIRFVDRSHRLGLLGSDHFADPAPDAALHAKYPDLEELGPAGPFVFQPGDAAVHGLYTVHGAPENRDRDPRWSFVVTYCADDTRYTGYSDAPSLLRKATDAGLAPGDVFRGPRYPPVSEPLARWDTPVD